MSPNGIKLEGSGLHPWVHNGLWYESEFEALWCGVLGYCGCGAPEAAAELIQRVLEMNSDIYEEPGLLLAAYACDSVGWTEHNSQIERFSLIESGEDALRVLREHSNEVA